jgi:O-antigen/teichoic acid export membrane protein
MKLLPTARRALTRLRDRGFGSAGIYLAATMLARGGAFVLVPLYTRRLSLEQYGDYALAQTLVQLLPTFLSLGLLSSLARMYYEGKDVREARARVGAVARWMAALTLGLALLLQIAVGLFWPAAGKGLNGRWELSCIIWAAAGGALAGVPAVYFRAAQRPLAASLFQLGQFLSVAGAGFLLVAVLNRGFRGSIEACALAYGTDGVVSLVFILVVLKGRMTRRSLIESLRFSIPFIPHFSANQLQQIGDRWIMKILHLQADLGAYAIASQVAAPVFMTTIAWNDTASPRIGEMYREGGLATIRARFKSIQRSYVVAAAIPSLLLIAGLPLIATILGPRGAGGLWLVPMLCGVLILETFYYPNSNVVFFASQASLIPKITIATAILNILFNVLLIPRLGAPGALLARGLSMGTRSAVMRLAAHRCFRLADR